MAKILTLCFIEREKELLLGLKKRGFGVGRWNGFGGKVEPEETIEDGAKREMLEEIGVQVVSLEETGVLTFWLSGKDEPLEVHVFRVLEYTGTPEESEEIAPQWFLKSALPFNKMWPDDAYWLPLFFAGKRFRGTFTFNEAEEIVSHRLEEVA